VKASDFLGDEREIIGYFHLCDRERSYCFALLLRDEEVDIA
jgi:hypothetical protein